VEHLAAEVGNVRRQKREHRLHRRIVQALLHSRCQPAGRKTDRDASGRDEKKLQLASPNEKLPVNTAATANRKRDKRRGVVNQAFTFEDDNDLARDAEILRHGQCGHCVRWRDERTENKPTARGNPVSAWKR
jgi:hypothetical protein